MTLAYDILWQHTAAADAISVSGHNYDGDPLAPVGNRLSPVKPADVAGNPTLTAAKTTFSTLIASVITEKGASAADPWRLCRTTQLRGGILRVTVAIYSQAAGKPELCVYAHNDLANAKDAIGMGLASQGQSLDALIASLAPSTGSGQAGGGK